MKRAIQENSALFEEIELNTVNLLGSNHVFSTVEKKREERMGKQ